jgi:hypothetical protein
MRGEPVAQSLANAIESNRVAHAYLFTGTRGVGMWHNYIYFEFHDDWIVCLDARTGKEVWRHEIARPKFRHVGIGDIVGQHMLPFLMPLHARAQHGKERDIVDRHGGLVSSEA